MTDKFQAPVEPPPNYRPQTRTGSPRASEGQQNVMQQKQRTPKTPTSGLSNQTRDLASNNPFNESNLGSPQVRQRPSLTDIFPQTTAAGRAPSHGPVSIPSFSSGDVEMGEDEFEPPPGPPPNRNTQPMQFDPPPGPPPGQTPAPQRESTEPPPYDPWIGPDDNLRLPPALHNTKSPTANSDYDNAARAHKWCRQTPLWPAVEHDDALVDRLEQGNLRLTVPPNTTDVTQYQPALGRSYIRTSSSLGDTILLSDIPIYASYRQSPLATGRPVTLYFEVHVLGLGDRYNQRNQVESGIAIGFVAPPYPAWRLPGWHRGSLGVHSDDGRRYVDDSYGGKDFTSAFKKGDVVGIGMTYLPPVHGDRVSMRCQVFFTRNGKKEGGWDLYEEQDAEADCGDIRGLEGDHDLLAAVGVFGSVELETVFRKEEWMYQVRDFNSSIAR